jgi:hypothetical protein
MNKKLFNMSKLSDSELINIMKTERFSLTCAPGGENNRGMEIIGRMPVKGEGFTAKDIEGLGHYFNELMGASFGNRKAFVLDLNALSINEYINKLLPDEDQARVLILRDWGKKMFNSNWTKEVYKELAPIKWDAEYLDPNKYRIEIVDGKEVKKRGKRMNKRARTNLCFVADREQEPSVYEGKGTIVDLKKLDYLYNGVEELKKQISNGLIKIGSKTKVEINVVEGNRYYNLKNTGIGFHGDTERVVVICISIGVDNYPMRWQWFKDNMPVGKSIDIKLNNGDVYIMSEKAVGADWKKSSKYTLRHAAGSKKYISLKKWEDKREAYEERLKKKKLKKEEKKKKKKLENDKKNDKKEENLEKEKIKLKEELEELEQKNKDIYMKSIKNHNWNDNDSDFYKWLDIEGKNGDNSCLDLLKIWSDPEILAGVMKNSPDFDIEMKKWNVKRDIYRYLCKFMNNFCNMIR